MEDTTSRIIPPKLKDAIIEIVFLRSRLKFAIPIETGLSLIFFFRLRISFLHRGKTDGFNGGNPCRDFHRLTDGNRHHDPTAYECQGNHNDIGNSVKSLGKQKKTAAYTQHCTNQNSDTAEFASLPLYNPLDLLWRCTNRPKLPVTPDFVIDGDTEDTLDHNIAADQNNNNHTNNR